jgi:methylated-DNA-[protein]-cysteine S-methyltransferase
MTELSYTHIDSPVGSLLVAGDDDALHYLCFPNSPNAIAPRSDWHQTDAPFLEVRRQLTDYFDGELQQFDLPLFLTGTAFQKGVWRHLSTMGRKHPLVQPLRRSAMSTQPTFIQAAA